MKQFTGFQHGVNLGGWLSQCDYSDERCRNFIRPEDFAIIKAWGVDHVRVPVDYDLLEAGADGAEPRGFGYLRLAADCCRSNGLHMVLDLHKTPGFSFDPDEGEGGFFESEAFQTRFYRIWEELARRFARDADIMAFELLNEVTEREFMPAWNRIWQECVRRIRVFAPTVPILVGGYWHNSAQSVKDIAPPPDDYIIYNFHCYEPLIFTHQGAYWMPTMDPNFRLPVTASLEEMEQASRAMLGERTTLLDGWPQGTKLSPAYFEAFVASAVEAAEARGVALYCGEYGVIDLVPPEQALEWYRVFSRAFDKLGIGRAAWTYRQMDFGLSDPRMDGVRPALLKLL
ncbi:MAG: cellulase family glycosylhydrolase [Oscillospiraceae bacterium]|nr:cellulase family glycosylhydrolase [Oscillospiraceae bacterium]